MVVRGRVIAAPFRGPWPARIGYLLCRPTLEPPRERPAPRRHNRAGFAGLHGIVVKSHGGTDALGFANAIGVAVDMVSNGFNARIKEELDRLSVEHEQASRATAL